MPNWYCLRQLNCGTKFGNILCVCVSVYISLHTVCTTIKLLLADFQIFFSVSSVKQHRDVTFMVLLSFIIIAKSWMKICVLFLMNKTVYTFLYYNIKKFGNLFDLKMYFTLKFCCMNIIVLLSLLQVNRKRNL